jgi:hypothetical protein
VVPPRLVVPPGAVDPPEAVASLDLEPPRLVVPPEATLLLAEVPPKLVEPPSDVRPPEEGVEVVAPAVDPWLLSVPDAPALLDVTASWPPSAPAPPAESFEHDAREAARTSERAASRVILMGISPRCEGPGTREGWNVGILTIHIAYPELPLNPALCSEMLRVYPFCSVHPGHRPPPTRKVADAGSARPRRSSEQKQRLGQRGAVGASQGDRSRRCQVPRASGGLPWAMWAVREAGSRITA